MFFPRHQAQPAEVEAASPGLVVAGHVIAALILLDGLLALGALLRVGHDPRDVLGLRCILNVPGFDLLARCRNMRLCSALPAPHRSARAFHFQSRRTQESSIAWFLFHGDSSH